MSKTNNLTTSWNGEIWQGVYLNFVETGGDPNVHEGQVWIEKQVGQAKATIGKYETDATISPVGLTTDYALSYIAATVAKEGKPLKIIDFGGGLGVSFLPLKSVLPDNQPLEFCVVEGKLICEQGKKLFENYAEISFTEQMPSTECVDIIHAGSSMHYVDDWIELLKQFSQYTPKFLIFADLPAGDIETFVTTQNYYDKQIPVRFWNIQQFINAVEDLGYRLIMKSRFHSKYISHMRNFDRLHRLNYFAQIIFESNSSL
jgi:putative methyltransferase (TIGR04325 family)